MLEAERAAYTLPPIQDGWQNQRPALPTVLPHAGAQGPAASLEEYQRFKKKKKMGNKLL